LKEFFDTNSDLKDFAHKFGQIAHFQIWLISILGRKLAFVKWGSANGRH